jgi:hypothetical protein
MPSINAQQIIDFLLKWLGVGIVLHFGLKIGERLDALLSFI